MQDANTVTTPLFASGSLKLSDGSHTTESTQYRQVIGSLQYLTLTRLDISFAVNKLSQFMQRPSTIHWSTVKQILRYLKGTLNHSLFLRKYSPLHLHAFADTDWAGNVDNRISTSGYIIFLCANPIRVLRSKR